MLRSITGKYQQLPVRVTLLPILGLQAMFVFARLPPSDTPERDRLSACSRRVLYSAHPDQLTPMTGRDAATSVARHKFPAAAMLGE